MAAFSKNIGIATNNKAQLWALKQGLQIAINLEIDKLIIETDSMYILSCFRSKEAIHNSHIALYRDVHKMMMNMAKATLKFGYREINGVADYLAKKRSTLHSSEETFTEQVDTDLSSLISKDLSGNYKRCITILCTDQIMLK